MGFRPLLGMVLVRNSFLKVLLTVRKYICIYYIVTKCVMLNRGKVLIWYLLIMLTWWCRWAGRTCPPPRTCRPSCRRGTGRQWPAGRTVQYSTAQCSTVQHSTVQYSTVQYSTVQYSTVQYSTVQYSNYPDMSPCPGPGGWTPASDTSPALPAAAWPAGTGTPAASCPRSSRPESSCNRVGLG